MNERFEAQEPESLHNCQSMRELDLEELEAVGGAAKRGRGSEGASSGVLHWFFSLFS